MNGTKLCILAFVLFFSTASHANLIKYKGYTLDESANIVTEDASGLEWLQWNQTNGLSVTEALTQFGSSGWGLASSTQVAHLVNSFMFDPNYTFSASANGAQIINQPFVAGDVVENSPFLQFITLFGNLYSVNFGTSDSKISTGAFFSHDAQSQGNVRRISVDDDLLFSDGSTFSNSVLFSQPFPASDNGSFLDGIALVRSSSLTSVSEPGILSLLVLGLLSIGVRRNREQR